MTIKILLADDHPLIRSGIRLELTRQAGIEVVAEALNSEDALTLALNLLPDILIIDVNMPGRPVYKIIQELKSKTPALKVLVLSAYGDLGTVSAMLQAGASAYVLKDDDPDVILQAVYSLQQGGNWYSRQVRELLEGLRLDSQESTPLMTERESALLDLLVAGVSNKGIGHQLGITERTVEFHLDRIMDKIGLRGRTSVALWAQEHQFLRTRK